MSELLKAAQRPCASCPYRKDVPSGVWHPEEYKKLPNYDGEILDQAMAGGTALFLCHQRNGKLCGGWLATHGTDNLFAMRISGDQVDPSVWGYTTDVPCFASGREACDHGLRDIDHPSLDAHLTMDRINRKRGDDDDDV